MRFAEPEFEKIAAIYAAQLLERARLHEPPITEDLQKIAAQISAEIGGLENKFKSPESLTGKLAEKVRADMKNLSLEDLSQIRAVTESIILRAKQNNDALRYTFLLTSAAYVFGFNRTLRLLTAQNYKLPERRIWNAWKNIGTTFDNGYRGINTTVISSQRQKFELQFHTKESFNLKMETHKLYKRMKSAEISIEEQDVIKRELVKMAEKIFIPRGVKQL